MWWIQEVNYRVSGQALFEEQVAEDVLGVFGQFVLLGTAAVVLKRQNHRILGRHERTVVDGVNRFLTNEIQGRFIDGFNQFVDSVRLFHILPSIGEAE